MRNDSTGQFEGGECLEVASFLSAAWFEGTGLLQHGSYAIGCKRKTRKNSVIVASTPGQIFAFTSDLAKIRPGIDCMLENVPPSLVNRAQEVSLAFQLIKLLQTCLNFQSLLWLQEYKIFLVEHRGQGR